MICMICHDTQIELSKICNCNESLVCNSCLKKLNQEKTEFCPICRSPLNIKITYDNKIFYKYLLSYLFIFSFLLLMEIYPILNIVDITEENENYSGNLFYNKSFQYYSVLTNVLLIQPLNFFYALNFFMNRTLTRIINKDGLLFISMMIIPHLIFDIILTTSNLGIDFFLYYFGCICIPFFIIPFGTMYLRLIYDYSFNIKNIMNEYSAVNKIRVRQTLGI